MCFRCRITQDALGLPRVLRVPRTARQPGSIRCPQINPTFISYTLSPLCNCKGNCGPKKCLKHHAHSRASKSTSRGSKHIQLHNNELEYITYLAGDLKRKE